MSIYDTLYALTPLKQAMCVKDDSGNLCVQSIPSAVSSSTPAVSSAISNLWMSSQSNSEQAALIPNTTTYHNTNLVFLFLQPSLASSDLCTPCTRNVMNSYTTYESSVPYAPGLAQSPLMSGQTALYNAITNECGADFMNDGAVQAAGGLKGGPLSGAAPRTVGVNFGALSMTLGAVAVAFVALL